jgi:hypothetical protein
MIRYFLNTNDTSYVDSIYNNKIMIGNLKINKNIPRTSTNAKIVQKEPISMLGIILY